MPCLLVLVAERRRRRKVSHAELRGRRFVTDHELATLPNVYQARASLACVEELRCEVRCQPRWLLWR